MASPSVTVGKNGFLGWLLPLDTLGVLEIGCSNAVFASSGVGVFAYVSYVDAVVGSESVGKFDGFFTAVFVES